MKNPEDPNLNINVRLLRRIEKYILEYPEKFDMAEWVRPFGMSLSEWEDMSAFDQPEEFTLCSTTACIAGWTCLLTEKKVERRYLSSRATEKLGLTELQAERLFKLSRMNYQNCWPVDLESRYLKAVKNHRWKDAARIAVERIERFIATKGAE